MLVALLLTLLSAIPALAQNPDYSASISTNPATVYQNADPAPTITVTVTNLQNQTSKDLDQITLTLPAGFYGTTGVTTSRSNWSNTISADARTITLTANTSAAEVPGGTTPRTSMAISFRASTTGSGTQAISVVCTNSNGVAMSSIPVAPTFTVVPCTVSLTDPTDQSVTSGQSAAFTVTPSSGATLQWQRSTDAGATYANVSGEMSSTITLTGVTTSMSGYRYRAVASTPCSTLTSAAATLTVSPITTTTTLAPATATYGDASVTLQATVAPAGANGLVSFTVDGSPVGSAAVSAGTASLAIDPSSLGAGTHQLEAAYGGATEYTSSTGSATLEIAKATLTITAQDATREYGDANPTLTVGYAGFVNGENESSLGGALEVSTTATPTSAIGTWPITASGYTSDNYEIGYVGGTLTIEPATLTITGPAVAREYGDANPSLDGGFSGAKNGETFTVSGSTSAVATTPIGTYDVVPSVTGATLSNYDVVPVNGTLTIGKATLTITAPTLGREYGDANPSLDGSFSGEKNGETFTVTGSTTATETSIVGSYDVVPSVTGATLSNYDVVPVNGTLTIGTATLTITAPTLAREYGDANPSLDGSFSGAKNGETFDVTGSTSAVATSSIGDYDVIPAVTGATLSNYDVVPVNGTLTVDKATLTITAPTLGREYGDANPSLDGTFDGAKNGETFSVTGSTTATETSIVGSYDVVPAVTGATLSNYDVVPVNGTLTIGTATLTITAPTLAREYGDANPSLDGGFSGAKNGETFVVTGSTVATETSSIGDYPVIPAVTGATLSNYVIAPINGTLTIGKATLTITAPTLGREYGEANPSLDGSFSGAKNGETFVVTGSTPATETSAFGDYVIVPAVTGATLSNYDIVPVNGTLTIGKATLTITAPTLAREYGDANPSLDGSFSGAKNGETFVVTGSTIATETSSFGNYDIVPAVTGATLANYDVVPVIGTLTVDKAVLTITAPTLARYHGQPNPSLDGTFDGAKNGETFTVTGSTTATPASPVGDYDVIPAVTGATLANYTVVPVLGTLTVIPVCPTIEVGPVSATVCAGQPASFSVTAAGTGPFSYQWRRNGSEIPGANLPTYSISSVAAGHLGTYDVIVSAYCSPVTSATATLALDVPVITSNPTNVSVCAGQPASFSVSATGGCVSYQWRRNGVNLSNDATFAGVTTSTLTVNTASVDVAGTYDVLVTGVASGSATLTVTPTFAATASPATIAYKLGKLRTISATLIAGTTCQTGAYTLESITANEPISAGDIQYASYNTTPADVSFNLASRRNGSSPRIYTIRYKGTDAFGNVSYTTTTVTVPLVGGMKPTGPEDETDAVTGLTGAAILEQNAPNPFSGSTDLRFVLPIAGATRLAVYDMKGSLVATLVDEHREAGLHIVRWDGTLSSGAPLESGTYVYRLESATGIATRTMSIVR